MSSETKGISTITFQDLRNFKLGVKSKGKVHDYGGLAELQETLNELMEQLKPQLAERATQPNFGVFNPNRITPIEKKEPSERSEIPLQDKKKTLALELSAKILYYKMFELKPSPLSSIEGSESAKFSLIDKLIIYLNAFLCTILLAFDRPIYDRMHAIASRIDDVYSFTTKKKDNTVEANDAAASGATTIQQSKEPDPEEDTPEYTFANLLFYNAVAAMSENFNRIFAILTPDNVKDLTRKVLDILNKPENINNFKNAMKKAPKANETDLPEDFKPLSNQIYHALFPNFFNKDGSVILPQEEVALT